MSVSPELFAVFSGLVEDACGLHYTEREQELFDSKVSSQAQESGHDALLDYYYRLRYDDPAGAEIAKLVEALVVHETYFFREPAQLAQLVETCIAPRVRTHGRARVWSAASSSGEEPYTLAMFLDERDLLDRVEIIATDISAVTVAAARLGRYLPRSIRTTEHHALVARYLEVDERGVTVAPRIRNAVQFSTLNLVDKTAHLSLGMFDAILCRNVLIYFTDEEITRVIARLASHLAAPHGLLAVGIAESLVRCGTALVCEQHGSSFFYRVAA